MPVIEVRKQYKDLIGSTKSSLVGPGNKDNPILVHFQYGHFTNDLEKLDHKTSLLFCWFIRVHSKEASSPRLAEKLAVIFWVRAAMPLTNLAASEGRLKHLNPKQHPDYPDLLVVTGRVSLDRKVGFHGEFLPILMSQFRTAWLIMVWAHNQDHAGIDTTFQTSFQYAWIIGGRSLARTIKRSCVRCRYSP